MAGVRRALRSIQIASFRSREANPVNSDPLLVTENPTLGPMNNIE